MSLSAVTRSPNIPAWAKWERREGPGVLRAHMRVLWVSPCPESAHCLFPARKPSPLHPLRVGAPGGPDWLPGPRTACSALSPRPKLPPSPHVCGALAAGHAAGSVTESSRLRGMSLSWFPWDSPDFSADRPTSWETCQSCQTQRDGCSSEGWRVGLKYSSTNSLVIF